MAGSLQPLWPAVPTAPTRNQYLVPGVKLLITVSLIDIPF